MKHAKLLFLIFLFLQSCVPNFAPEHVSVEQLKESDVIIELFIVKGVMDQKFPSYITIKKKNKIDTLCK